MEGLILKAFGTPQQQRPMLERQSSLLMGRRGHREHEDGEKQQHCRERESRIAPLTQRRLIFAAASFFLFPSSGVEAAEPLPQPPVGADVAVVIHKRHRFKERHVIPRLLCSLAPLFHRA